MSRHHATAVRRFLLVASALAATLAAHALATGDVHPVPAAPLIWGSLAALTVLTGSRRPGVWRRRRAPEILVRLLGLQVVLHLAMTAAPWAFGLGVHHRPALVTPLVLIAHGASALVLTALLARAERILALAVAVARIVREALAPATARARHRALAAVASLRALQGPATRGVRARGPPAPAG